MRRHDEMPDHSGTSPKELAVKVAASELIRLGYRRTSNKYRMVSRIDREDWIIFMAKHLRRAPADFYVPGEPDVDGGWCDFYRRVLSHDKIELVDEEVFKLIPGSGWDKCGYVDPDSVDL